MAGRLKALMHGLAVQGLAGIAIALALAFAGMPVHAGPFQDFEKEAGEVYGVYRMALFSTNSGNQNGSVETITKFAAGWGALTGKWLKTPPPQYADDKQFPADADKVSAISSKALVQAKAGDLKAAHQTLEAIRDVLGGLRKRNGVIIYSDHMNAYHSQMEKILTTSYAGAPQRLTADAGVLAYLAQALKDNAPATMATSPEFAAALAAVQQSVVALQQALSGKDPKAVMSAIKQLKMPYAKLFVRWG